jgi:HAD superfamily hydrolase (TIGR01509 family)
VIEAIIFDLDGTLVQTEPAKALSHARAVAQVSPDGLREEQVLPGLQDQYGVSERRTAEVLIERFGLQHALRTRLAEFDAETLWEALLAVQRRIYAGMLTDREAIRSAQRPHIVALLDEVRQDGLRLGLATMSFQDQAERVLEALELADAFEVILTADDVELGKPDPEIYLLVARQLGVCPERCLVIEDTLAGVQSALAAGMWCVAVPTELTRAEVHDAAVLDERWIVDDPALLRTVVRACLGDAEAQA